MHISHLPMISYTSYIVQGTCSWVALLAEMWCTGDSCLSVGLRGRILTATWTEVPADSEVIRINPALDSKYCNSERNQRHRTTMAA